MPSFSLYLTAGAKATLKELERDSGLAKRLSAVRKTLARLESNPRHPGLQSHKFSSLSGPSGEEVFEVYAEQNTPAAYRVFWYYGPERGQITILAITSHP
ncbi:MAG: hypothetical protein WAU32_05050 [Thermoanaerobaculia bacterium]